MKKAESTKTRLTIISWKRPIHAPNKILWQNDLGEWFIGPRADWHTGDTVYVEVGPEPDEWGYREILHVLGPVIRAKKNS
jgi:hypothetical protein